MTDRERPPGTPPALPLERERERTVELLSNHFANDNLSMEELERRIEGVYRAKSLPALRELTHDLPSEPDGAPAARPSALPQVFTPQRERIVSVMAETRRSGMWELPQHLDLWCVMSDTKLDLSETPIRPGVTEIHVRGLMAALHILVPRGVRVVVQPSAIMSSVNDDDVNTAPVSSASPVIRITGRVIMTELKLTTGTAGRQRP